MLRWFRDKSQSPSRHYVMHWRKLFSSNEQLFPSGITLCLDGMLDSLDRPPIPSRHHMMPCRIRNGQNSTTAEHIVDRYRMIIKEISKCCQGCHYVLPVFPNCREHNFPSRHHIMPWRSFVCFSKFSINDKQKHKPSGRNPVVIERCEHVKSFRQRMLSRFEEICFLEKTNMPTRHNIMYWLGSEYFEKCCKRCPKMTRAREEDEKTKLRQGIIKCVGRIPYFSNDKRTSIFQDMILLFRGCVSGVCSNQSRNQNLAPCLTPSALRWRSMSTAATSRQAAREATPLRNSWVLPRRPRACNGAATCHLEVCLNSFACMSCLMRFAARLCISIN